MATVGSLIVNVLGNTAPLTASLAAARGEMAAFSGTTAAHGSATATAFNGVRLAAVAAGVGAVAFGAVSLRAAADFQEQMAIINTIARQTPEELTRTGNAIRQIAADTGTALPDATKAFYDLLSAGVSASNAFSVLRLSATLSIGALSTTSQAVDLLTTAINAYHLDANGARVATNQFALAVQDGKVTADQIAASFSNIAPIARAAGVGIDEISATYAVLTARGVDAGEATTQMQRAILELMKPSAALSDLQGELGVNFAKVADQRGLVVALEEVRKAAEANGVPLTDIFTRVEGLNFVLATTGSNFKGYAAELRNMHDANGTAAAQAAERMDTFDRTTARLGVTVQNLLINVGTALLPTFTNLANAVIPIVAQFGQWAAANPGLTSNLLALGAALGVVAVATFVLGPAIAVLASPLGLVIAAVAAFGIAWANNWGNIQGVTAGVISWVQANLVPAFQRVQAGIGQAMVWIQANVAPVFQRVMATVGQAVGWVVTNVLPAFQRGVAAVASWVQANWPTISSVASQVFGGVSNAISVAARIIANVVTTVWPVLMRIANVLFPVIGTAATGLLRVVDGAFKLLGGVFQGLATVAHAVSTGIGTTWRALTGVFSAVSAGIRAAVGVASGVINGLLGVVSTVAKAIADFFGWITGNTAQAQAQLNGLSATPTGQFVPANRGGTPTSAVRTPTLTTPRVPPPPTRVNLPTLQHGGIIPGSGPQLIVGHGGETVVPKGQGAGQPTVIHRTIQIVLDGRVVAETVDREMFGTASGFSSGFAANNPIIAS